MAILLNSDIFIDALRDVEWAKETLKNLIGENCFYSIITLSEILSHKSCDDRETKNATVKIFSAFSGVPVDEQIAQKAASFRRRYSLLLPDAIIAATAAQLKAELLTTNTKEFSRIREIKIRGPY